MTFADPHGGLKTSGQCQWVMKITGLHTQKAYTHTGTTSFRIILLSAHAYAFFLRIAIRQPMRTHTGLIAYMHEWPTKG